jgi:hypothetical protein
MAYNPKDPLCEDLTQGAFKLSYVFVLYKGVAVGASLFGGVGLMGAYHNLVKGAVVCVFAVVRTVLYTALNAVVSLLVFHLKILSCNQN